MTESGLVRIRVVVVVEASVAAGATDEDAVECVRLGVFLLKGFLDGVSSGEVGTKYEGVSESESESEWCI